MADPTTGVTQVFRRIESELQAPNLVIVNPRNGHAHLVHLLGAWVETDF